MFRIRIDEKTTLYQSGRKKQPQFRLDLKTPSFKLVEKTIRQDEKNILNSDWIKKHPPIRLDDQTPTST